MQQAVWPSKPGRAGRRAGAAGTALILGVLAAALVSPSFAPKGYAQPSLSAQSFEPEIREQRSALEALYRRLHSNPELSFQEENTAAHLAAETKALGFEVTTGVGGHGVVAVLTNGAGPTVLVRTDMDALPVEERTGLPYASKVEARDPAGRLVPVMHACGHDVHMTAWMGAARFLAGQRTRWSGTLVMIAQPAEEKGAGARAMLDDGLYARFPRPDFALALHSHATLPAGSIGYTSGFALANVDSVDIVIHGKGGHGAYPHKTIDPIVIASRVVVALQTIVAREIDPVDPAVVTVGAFHAGTKHNIIPDRAELQLTVRSYEDDVRAHLLSAIERIAVHTARAAGAPRDPEVRASKKDYTHATYNDPALVKRVVGALSSRFGASRVVEIPPTMGGEDFSAYGRAGTKAFLFWLGTVEPRAARAAARKGKPLPSLHAPIYAPHLRPTLLTGAQALATAVTELMPADGIAGRTGEAESAQ